MPERNLLPDDFIPEDNNGIMKWFKEVVLDLLVTVIILVAVILKIDWLAVLVVGYTGLILFARTVVVLNKSSNVKKTLRQSSRLVFSFELCVQFDLSAGKSLVV